MGPRVSNRIVSLMALWIAAATALCGCTMADVTDPTRPTGQAERQAHAQNHSGEDFVKSESADLRFQIGLLVAMAAVLVGCGQHQIGFQPLGHDNRVADEMRAGDDQRAGGDLLKVQDSSSTRSDRVKIQGETVHVGDGPTVAAVSVCVALALVFAFAIFSFDRWMFYRKMALTQADAISRGRDRGEILDLIRPRVRRLGARRKRAFDRLLRAHGCLVTRRAED